MFAVWIACHVSMLLKADCSHVVFAGADQNLRDRPVAVRVTPLETVGAFFVPGARRERPRHRQRVGSHRAPSRVLYVVSWKEPSPWTMACG